MKVTIKCDFYNEIVIFSRGALLSADSLKFILKFDVYEMDSIIFLSGA